MFRWLRQTYANRIVNVNVNIVTAGAIALAITVGVVHLAIRLGVENKLVISAITFLADIIADVIVYYLLHWVANHMPRRAPRIIHPAYAQLSFIKDATLVQFERALLSPILYTIAIGLQQVLLHRGVSAELATLISFATGVLTARVFHTIWMVRNERKAARAAAANPVEAPQTGP